MSWNGAASSEFRWLDSLPNDRYHRQRSDKVVKRARHMAAYNWVAFEGRCPRCMGNSPIKAQCHVASSYDGDDSGRFHDRTYGVGQAMAWWPRSDRRWQSWKNDAATPVEEQHGVIQECCYAGCQACGAELYAVVEFRDLAITRIVGVGVEALWPAGYSR